MPGSAGDDHSGSLTPPRPLLFGAGAVLAFAVLATMLGRNEGMGTIALPPGVPVSEVAFQAEDQVDGSIVVRNTEGGRVITTIRPGQDGFIRGTLRGLAQARQRAGLGSQTPFRLIRFADGRLALRDDLLDRSVPLEAFGPTNAQAFARLLPGGADTAEAAHP